MLPTDISQDPAAQLELLAQRQADVLSLKLGKEEGSHNIPTRPLPYGSEGVKSPTYNEPHAASIVPTTCSQATIPAPATMIQEPSYMGPGAAWEKDETYLDHETPLGPSEEEKDVLIA